MKSHGSERGQAIILLVFGVIGLLGAAALAVDGGQLYSNRRHAQNTVDTASYSGALVIANGGTDAAARAAAGNRVTQNGYDYASDPMVTFNPSLNSHVNITGPHSDAGIYYLVEVTMTTELTTAFAHMVFGGPLETTVTSTARAKASQSFLPGEAVVGLSTDECKTVWFTGDAVTEINGGGVFSNADPVGPCPSGEASGQVSVVVNDGDISSVGDFDVGPDASVSPAPTTGADQQQFPILPTPDCSGLTARDDSDLPNLSPGIYDEIVINGGTNTLAAGMYCITGTGGIRINGSAEVIGAGVFFYIEDGDVWVNGEAIVILSAPTDLTDASGNQWGGMLMYMAYENDGTITLDGDGDTTYTGTIYAPSPPGGNNEHKCNISGEADTVGYGAQIICYTVKISGEANFTVNYEEEQSFQLPPTVDLFE